MDELRGPLRKEWEINFKGPRETANGQEVANQKSAGKNVCNSFGEKSTNYLADSQKKNKTIGNSPLEITDIAIISMVLCNANFTHVCAAGFENAQCFFFHQLEALPWC